MTNPQGRSSIAATLELERLTADLQDAQADLALLERLKSAQDRVVRLTAEHGKAAKERDKAIAAEANANEARRFAALTNVYVTESAETVRESVLRSGFTIHWTKATWNGRSNPPTEHSVAGFGACPPDVLEYLIEKSPESIPEKIKALCPDNPRQALGVYFRGLRRGFIQR